MIFFNHVNFNVLDLDRSLRFYDEALGFKPTREISPPDGSFKIVFLGDSQTKFALELTWLRDHPEPYDLGEVEFHLAVTATDFDEVKQKHKDMGIICFENHAMGIYFIEDPDGYWIEILPPR